jgi:hypothetical protein
LACNEEGFISEQSYAFGLGAKFFFFGMFNIFIVGDLDNSKSEGCFLVDEKDIDKTCNQDANFEKLFSKNCEKNRTCEIEFSYDYFSKSDSCKKR